MPRAPACIEASSDPWSTSWLRHSKEVQQQSWIYALGTPYAATDYVFPSKLFETTFKQVAVNKNPSPKTALRAIWPVQRASVPLTFFPGNLWHLFNANFTSMLFCIHKMVGSFNSDQRKSPILLYVLLSKHTTNVPSLSQVRTQNYNNITHNQKIIIFYSKLFLNLTECFVSLAKS